MELKKYMELINLSESRANERIKKIKLTKNMKTRVNKYVVPGTHKRRKLWLVPTMVRLSPLVTGNYPRPIRF